MENEILIALSKSIFPYTISRIVDLGNCFVVSVCDAYGQYLMQPPYSVSRDGTKVSFYNVFNKENIERLRKGKVVYSDPAASRRSKCKT